MNASEAIKKFEAFLRKEVKGGRAVEMEEYPECFEGFLYDLEEAGEDSDGVDDIISHEDGKRLHEEIVLKHPDVLQEMEDRGKIFHKDWNELMKTFLKYEDVPSNPEARNELKKIMKSHPWMERFFTGYGAVEHLGSKDSIGCDIRDRLYTAHRISTSARTAAVLYDLQKELLQEEATALQIFNEKYPINQ